MMQTDWLIVLTGVLGLFHVSFAKYIDSNYNGVAVTEIVWFSIIWGAHHVIVGLMFWLLTKSGGSTQQLKGSGIPIFPGVMVVFIGTVSIFLTMISVILWLLFIEKYNRGVGNKLKYVVFGLVVSSGLMSILATVLKLSLRTGVLYEERSGGGGIVVSELSNWLFYIELIGIGGAVLIGVLWFYSAVEKIDGVGVKTVVSVTMSFLLPWVTVMMYKLNIVNDIQGVVEMLCVSSLIGLGGLWVAVSIDEVFDILPGTNEVKNNIQSDGDDIGIVIINSECCVSDLNGSVEHLLGIDKIDVINKHINKVLPNGIDCEDISNGKRVVFESDTGKTIECKIQDPPCKEKQTGKVLILKDITSKITEKQRVSVLNRVLRHNLRNELNAINGYMQLIEAQCDNDISNDKREIDKSIEELNDIGRKAQRIEKVLSMTPHQSEETRIREIISYTKQNVENSSEIVTTDISKSRTTNITPGILEMVISEAVRNAIQHGNATEVQIRIKNDKMVIKDNGVGIPDEEIKAITSTVEDALNHGSGLGLWLMKWGIDMFGSTLNIHKENGTVIEFEVINTGVDS